MLPVARPPEGEAMRIAPIGFALLATTLAVPALAADAAAGKATFKQQCALCHTAERGERSVRGFGDWVRLRRGRGHAEGRRGLEERLPGPRPSHRRCEAASSLRDAERAQFAARRRPPGPCAARLAARLQVRGLRKRPART